MREITTDVVIDTNKECLNPGEPFGILDDNRLKSALGNQWAPYPMDEQAIASVFRSLIQNHAFMNANKRTAVAVMEIMADDIGREVVLSDDDLGDLVYQLADEGGSKISVNSIANKLFGLDLEENLEEARKQSALKSNGIFSVLNNEWIKEPVKEDIPDIDEEAFNKEFAKWEARYFDLVGDSIENIDESTSKVNYHYRGPVYQFKDVYSRDWEAYKHASSLKQAINLFNRQARLDLGFTQDAGGIHINPDYIEEVTKEEEPETEIAHCEKCGRELNDAGECPFCDLGDESVLDESAEGSKTEEIENFIEDIYDLRKESIATEGEYGIGNLVFKELRNLGYLDNLKDLKNALKSKELSLHEHLSRDELRKKVPEITEDDVKSWINNNVGWDMTIDPDTLKRADFSALPEGWIVTQNFKLDNLFDHEDYAGMTDFIKKVLLNYGDKFYIGTYKMKYGKHRGQIAIDVNRVIKDTKEAIIDGLRNLQESIYRYDEYIFLTHNLISRRTGKKKSYPFTKEELADYGLDDCLVSEPINGCMSIELVDGIFDTNIPAVPKKK